MTADKLACADCTVGETCRAAGTHLRVAIFEAPSVRAGIRARACAASSPPRARSSSSSSDGRFCATSCIACASKASQSWKLSSNLRRPHPLSSDAAAADKAAAEAEVASLRGEIARLAAASEQMREQLGLEPAPRMPAAPKRGLLPIFRGKRGATRQDAAAAVREAAAAQQQQQAAVTTTKRASAAQAQAALAVAQAASAARVEELEVEAAAQERAELEARRGAEAEARRAHATAAAATAAEKEAAWAAGREAAWAAGREEARRASVVRSNDALRLAADKEAAATAEAVQGARRPVTAGNTATSVVAPGALTLFPPRAGRP